MDPPLGSAFALRQAHLVAWTQNYLHHIKFRDSGVNDKLYLMSKVSPSLSGMPPQAAKALAELGERLALARLRRKQSQRAWAQRLGVSVPTLASMERGEPGVSMGVYATALWIMGRAGALPGLADPQQDLGALEADVRVAAQERELRSRRGRAARAAKDEA